MRIVEWFKARKRGERRVAPYGTTGRVFEKKEGEAPTSHVGELFNSDAIGEVTLTARVIRVDGTIEEL